ncbi:threonine/serine exporter family protein [Romboutsia sp.]|uniref:threonine/serine exporter family protein n=1 Tax=Romboutsia sp. TaxID=1965302 RepID=UPI003F3D5534
MTDMPIYLHFLYSTLATVGFSIFLNSPVSTLLPAGITGGVGWAIFYYLMLVSSNSIFSNFIAAAIVSLMSEILARKLKHPAILFVIPGIIPLVPGLGMYNTMLYLVQGNYDLAIATGADVLFVASAIALGVLVITSLSRTISIFKIVKKAAK